jgi:hypothetical protein
MIVPVTAVGIIGVEPSNSATSTLVLPPLEGTVSEIPSAVVR